MKKVLLTVFFPVIFLAFPAFSQVKYQKIQVEGRQVEVKISGLEDRKPLQPIVILEAGLREDFSTWDQVIDQVSEFSPVMAYNRAGIGASESSEEAITIQARVDQLNQLLKELKIDPPYILVGNNWGSEIIRGYGTKYPENVSGMIYLDPLTNLDNVENLSAYLTEKGLNGEQLATEYLNFQKSIKNLRFSGMKDETISYLSILEENKLDWQSKEIPQMKEVVILGRRNDMYPIMSQLSMDSKEFYKTIIAGKVSFFEEQLLGKQKSSLILSPASMNFLPYQESTLIALSVKKLITTDIAIQIFEAAEKLDSEEFGAYLNGLESYIPQSLLKEREYNMVGYSLMRADKNEHAVLIFQKNLEKNPNSANAYDSYGEGLMALGKIDQSIPLFEKAIELGKKSNHRDLGLFIKNLAKSEELLNK